MIVPQKEQNSPFIAIKRGYTKDNSSRKIPHEVFRMKTIGSNISRNSVDEEELVTPKYRNNESYYHNPMSFSIEDDLLGN